jgi:hypothetical protein
LEQIKKAIQVHYFPAGGRMDGRHGQCDHLIVS